MKPNLLFLTLNVFSATGGIEKVAKVAGKALSQICEKENIGFALHSAYDNTADCNQDYVPAHFFRGFGGRRVSFVWQSLRKGRRASVILLSHSNLLPVGYVIKRLFPRTKLLLLAHGIEVWSRLPAWRRQMLKCCDHILPVSQFTRNTMLQVHGLDADRLTVVNNCLDPFLPRSQKEKSVALLERYGFTADNKILLTLTRLSANERYKGYDEVLMAVKALKHEHPGLRYLVVGKADKAEKDRLRRFIRQQRLEKEVVLAGFVPDDELAAHFTLADVFIMPSRKEGFGIVFIEALSYGLPVIAGNRDGSVDALANGTLGTLVNPEDPAALRAAIQHVLNNKKEFVPNVAEVRKRFDFTVYKKALEQAIGTLLTDRTSCREMDIPRKKYTVSKIQVTD
jgi:glycosyltransferase involved in cell wall biosynthesis